MQSKKVENVGMIYFSDHFPFVREISMILYFGRKSIKNFQGRNPYNISVAILENQ